jgi:hypothetical protein
VPQGEPIPVQQENWHGREVHVYTLPSGYDATNSPARAATLASMSPEDLLYGAPDPDLPTGGDWQLPQDHPTVLRALRQRCRDFTQHRQPLVPGWRQLLALRNSEDRPLGMPTGIGWYTHYWLSEMCDGVTMRLSQDGSDIETLLYARPADNQSEQVWATPGGYVVKADVRPDITPLQAASARRTFDRTGRDVLRLLGVPLRVKYPISSGNTLVAGLATKPYARFEAAPDYRRDPALALRTPARERAAGIAGFISLRALCESNPNGGVSGKNHGDNPFPIWTTHFEYVVAGLEAFTDAENRHRFGMSPAQFARIGEIAAELQAEFPMLQEV